MKLKAEITTNKSFYRLNSGRWRKYYFLRYFKRREAKGECWLIWRIVLAFFDIECYALHTTPQSYRRINNALETIRCKKPYKEG